MTDPGAVGGQSVVLVKGEIGPKPRRVLCRVASSCLLSTALDSAECDCREQIDESLRLIHREGVGIFLYLRQDGRGHGVATKVRALANKNAGMDTFEAVEALGLAADIRSYGQVLPILSALGVCSIRLLSSNPDKVAAIRATGVVVDEVLPIAVSAPAQATRHLDAKRARGHLL